MNISIRKAEKRDCPAIMKLINELALFEKAPEQVSVSLSHFEECGFGANPIWWAFVVEDKNVIIGFALYYIRYSTWKGKRLYLEDLYVQPTYRRKGIGSLLLDKLIQEAKEIHCTGMMWQALDWNTDAITFYKNKGAHIDDEWINCHLEF